MLHTRSISLSRLVMFAGALFIAGALTATTPQQAAAQTCGGLAGCNGPFSFFGTWYLTGNGTECPGGCAVASSSGNVTCKVGQDFGGNNLSAVMSNDTTAEFCGFNCGARGNCQMRGGDGLPVELLHFGVE
jgi:hypothetical protein